MMNPDSFLVPWNKRRYFIVKDEKLYCQIANMTSLSSQLLKFGPKLYENILTLFHCKIAIIMTPMPSQFLKSGTQFYKNYSILLCCEIAIMMSLTSQLSNFLPKCYANCSTRWKITNIASLPSQPSKFGPTFDKNSFNS